MDPLAKKWNPSREYESMTVGELIPGMYFLDIFPVFMRVSSPRSYFEKLSLWIFLQCGFLTCKGSRFSPEYHDWQRGKL